MTKLFFRIMLFGLGIFLTFIFGKDMALPVWHKMTGVQVEGKVAGFLAGRGATKTVVSEPTGVRKGKRRARRIVFRYPSAPGGMDTLENHSSVGTFILFGTFETGETVPVVFAKDNPTEGRIFNGQMIFLAFLCTLLGLYMVRIGVLGRL